MEATTSNEEVKLVGKPIYPHYHLLTRIETIKSNWFLWLVDCELADGSMVRGTMEADLIGCSNAFDTFKPCEDETLPLTNA